jgi:hypothetical protein
MLPNWSFLTFTHRKMLKWLSNCWGLQQASRCWNLHKNFNFETEEESPREQDSHNWEDHLSRDRVSIDGIWIDNLNYLRADDYK